MCVHNGTEVDHREMIAYKIMERKSVRFGRGGGTLLISAVEGSRYQLGADYNAKKPKKKAQVNSSFQYDKGFHAYPSEKDAWDMLYSPNYRKNYSFEKDYVVVKVKLKKVFLRGKELNWYAKRYYIVYVAKQCEFLEIMPLTPQLEKRIIT